MKIPIYLGIFIHDFRLTVLFTTSKAPDATETATTAKYNYYNYNNYNPYPAGAETKTKTGIIFASSIVCHKNLLYKYCLDFLNIYYERLT